MDFCDVPLQSILYRLLKNVKVLLLVVDVCLGW
jgi:hypothetical protein